MILAPPQSPDLQAQFQSAMQGVLRRPGKGRRKGQWVLGQGEFSGLSEDEVYGRLRARQGGNSGSGPGGGLRSGGLGGSGIDYVKRGMPSNSGVTPSAAAPATVKAAPAATAPVQSTTTTELPASLANPVGTTPKTPAAPPVEVVPPASAEQAPPNSVTVFGSPWGKSEPEKKPEKKAPDVLQKPEPQAFVPDAKTKLAQSMEDVKNMQSKDRSDAVMARAKAAIDLKTAPTDVNSPEFQEWQKTDPDAIANRKKEWEARANMHNYGAETNRLKERAAKNMETNAVGADRGFQEALVDKGMRFDPAASIQTGKERAAGLRGTMTTETIWPDSKEEMGQVPDVPQTGAPLNFPPPVLQKPAASPIKAAGANQIAPAVAPTDALMNGEAPQKNPFAKKPLDNRLTAGLASNKRDKFSNKNPFV